MPRAIRRASETGREVRFADVKGKVLTMPPLKGVAWFVQHLDYPPGNKSGMVHLISLPVGREDIAYWSSTRNRIDNGTLIVTHEMTYSRWQDAALMLYGELAKPYVLPVEATVEQLVAAIEGLGEVC